MHRTAHAGLVTVLAVVALAGGIAALPPSTTAAGLIFACVNNSSGTIHIVGEGSTCSNNEVKLVWANQDQITALQQAVAALRAQVAAAGHSLTSPNGQYTIEVADDKIVLQGPGVSIRLDAGDPASPVATVTVTGMEVVVVAGQNTNITSGASTQIESGATTRIESGVDTSIKSDGAIEVEAAGTVTIKGATVNIN